MTRRRSTAPARTDRRALEDSAAVAACDGARSGHVRPMRDGDIGMLTFFDLANVGSVSAVMTEDLGFVEGGRVRVLGRAAGEARGCALGIGQFSATEAAEAFAMSAPVHRRRGAGAQSGKRRPERRANGRGIGTDVRALAESRLRAAERGDRGNRALGGLFRSDARELDRRVAETVHRRRVKGDGGHGGPPHCWRAKDDSDLLPPATSPAQESMRLRSR